MGIAHRTQGLSYTVLLPPRQKFILFWRERREHREWTGSRQGPIARKPLSSNFINLKQHFSLHRCLNQVEVLSSAGHFD